MASAPLSCRFFFVIAFAAIVTPSLRAQLGTFDVEGKPVEIHGFASQGFAISSGNNYLTMNTRQGSFAFTDFGGNIAVRLTPKLRIGAQIYDRNVGDLGNFHPSLDWATVDYQYKDWLGIRVGKVKTVLGLYNDTQDLEFLHPWALMPQSLYPLDIRGTILSHTGGDLYGHINLKRFGNLSYTAYAGLVPDDPYGGYIYALKLFRVSLNETHGRTEGGDLHWTLKGLTAGLSFANYKTAAYGTSPPFDHEHQEHSRTQQSSRFYLQYEHGPLRLETEYGQSPRDEVFYNPYTSVYPDELTNTTRSGYAAASYRLSKHWQLGSYYSAFYQGSNLAIPAAHIVDKVASVRFDVTSFWDIKLEGHFINGHASEPSVHGFYALNNPQGFVPDTNILVIRTGFEF